MKRERLAELDPSPVKISHQQEWRRLIGVVLRLPLNHPGNGPTRHATALNEPLFRPRNPLVNSEVKPERRVGANVKVRR